MSGAFGDMGNLLKQAQEMQRELDRAREELRTAKVEGSSGGGAVRTEVNGDGQVSKIHIRPDVLEAKDAALVEDLVLAAVRDGIAKANALREQRLARLTGGLNLPGIFYGSADVAYPEPLEGLIQAFERFPGIGRRSAERLAFHVLRDPMARTLARAIERAVEGTRRCGQCCNASDSDPCPICADATRDRAIVCVVEEPRHVEALERAGVFRGVYHVLMGALNPADGTDESHLTLSRLVERVRRGGVREVILGTDPDSEGEATALRVLEALESLGSPGLVVTRLARGLPAGAAIEYLHRGVLEDALADRRPVKTRRPSNPA